MGARPPVAPRAWPEALTLVLSPTLTLARWERGQCTLSTLSAHHGPVYGVRLRGDRLASSSEDGSIKLWDLSHGTVRRHGVSSAWYPAGACGHSQLVRRSKW